MGFLQSLVTIMDDFMGAKESKLCIDNRARVCSSV